MSTELTDLSERSEEDQDSEEMPWPRNLELTHADTGLCELRWTMKIYKSQLDVSPIEFRKTI